VCVCVCVCIYIYIYIYIYTTISQGRAQFPRSRIQPNFPHCSQQHTHTCTHILTHAHKHTQLSRRVVRNSLDPEFNQTFRIAVDGNETDLELRVQLWDWDRFDEDDHMGDVILKINIDKVMKQQLDSTYPIIMADGMEYLKNAKGEKSMIHLKFDYTPARIPRPNRLGAASPMFI
jgi:hypothetical protein